MPYDIPRKSLAGYYPECNGLIPLWHYAEGSKVPGGEVRSGAPVQGCYSGDHRRRRDSDLDRLSLAAEPGPFVSSISPELTAGFTL